MAGRFLLALLVTSLMAAWWVLIKISLCQSSERPKSRFFLKNRLSLFEQMTNDKRTIHSTDTSHLIQTRGLAWKTRRCTHECGWKRKKNIWMNKRARTPTAFERQKANNLDHDRVRFLIALARRTVKTERQGAQIFDQDRATSYLFSWFAEKIKRNF